METGDVRKSLQHAMRVARQRAESRREWVAHAETAYATFLRHVATPLARQVADALRAEGVAVTISTPKDGLRLALEHGRDNYVELAFDTGGDQPQVVARTCVARGSHTHTDERPVKPGAGPDAVTEEDLLAFLLEALAPWLAR